MGWDLSWIRILKSDKVITKNYRLIPLTDKDVKILNKIFAYKIQLYIKRINHDEVGFIPGTNKQNQSVCFTILTNFKRKTI